MESLGWDERLIASELSRVNVKVFQRRMEAKGETSKGSLDRERILKEDFLKAHLSDTSSYVLKCLAKKICITFLTRSTLTMYSMRSDFFLEILLTCGSSFRGRPP